MTYTTVYLPPSKFTVLSNMNYVIFYNFERQNNR